MVQNARNEEDLWTDICQSIKEDIMPRLFKDNVYSRYIYGLTLLLFLLQFVTLFCVVYMISTR